MKKILKILSGIFLIAIILFVLLNVKIDKIDVVGNTKQSEEKLVNELLGENRISIIVFIKNLLFKQKIPFVENYNIDWETPFYIVINVKEKEPIGFIKKDILNVYFDEDGMIGEISDRKSNNIPEIRGINFKTFVKGEMLVHDNKELLNVLLDIIKRLKEYNLPLYLLEMDRAGNISVYIGSISVLIGNIENIDIKLSRINDIYPEIKDMRGTLDLSSAKDNTFDEKYIFKKG